MNADRRRIRAIASLASLAIAAGIAFAQEPLDVVQRAADALAKGDIAAFASAFDPKMPGFAKIRTDAADMVRQNDVQSTIRFSAGGAADWELRIAERENSNAVTHRHAKVNYRIEAGRIASFSPVDFFRPPYVDGAWNVLESLATALNAGDATEFISHFEKSIPGYDRIQAGAAVLAGEGEVNSSIQMQSNEGPDTARTIEVDWTLNLESSDTSIRRKSRQHLVQCRLELSGKQWKITALDPVDFFSPILLGMNFPHQGERGAVLFNRQLK
jgi:hypothetical protein